MLRTQIDQTGEALYAGHGEIEQYEVLIRFGEDLRDIVEGSGFRNAPFARNPLQGLLKRAANQWVVVRNQNTQIRISQFNLPLVRLPSSLMPFRHFSAKFDEAQQEIVETPVQGVSARLKRLSISLKPRKASQPSETMLPSTHRSPNSTAATHGFS